ncbi:MAG TPA: hypothetical protein VM900_12520 [Sphingomonas sp.]|nr:hypothetical protein [Sphingomonas sp.]
MKFVPSPALSALLVFSLGLVACSRAPDAQQELDSLDRDLANAVAGGGRDPAVAAAINDPIMVDPALAQSSNVNAIRPPDRPLSGAVPADAVADGPAPAAGDPAPAATAGCPSCAARRGALTLGALAERQRAGALAGCASRLRYAAGWSNRLPADLPLYPDARVAEAAGTDDGDCRLRAVSFTSAAPVARVIDWYYARARRAGFAATHEAQGSEHVVGGTRGEAAFVAYVSPRGSGSSVDLVANAGR